MVRGESKVVEGGSSRQIANGIVTIAKNGEWFPVAHVEVENPGLRGADGGTEAHLSGGLIWRMPPAPSLRRLSWSKITPALSWRLGNLCERVSVTLGYGIFILRRHVLLPIFDLDAR